MASSAAAVVQRDTPKSTDLLGIASVVALVAGAGYVFTPNALYSLGTTATGSFLQWPFTAAGIAIALVFPLIGLLLLFKSAGSARPSALRARAVGALLFMSPPLAVLSGGLGALTGWGGSPTLWFMLYGVAAVALVWRSATPHVALPVAAGQKLRVWHRRFAVVLIVFAALHVIVNVTAFGSVATYNQAANWFRILWRTAVGEPVLLVIIACQFATGLALVFHALAQRSTFEHAMQMASGLYLGTFLCSHTLAVAVLGRGLLNAGPSFAFASGGPGGLMASAGSASLGPYYGLVVIALAIHLARPLRMMLVRVVGAARARTTAGGLIALSCIVSSLIITALLTPTV